jgi:hypothetical protein
MTFVERKRVFATGAQMAAALRGLAGELEVLPAQMTFDCGTIAFFDYGELRVTLEQSSVTCDGWPEPPRLKVSLKTTIQVSGIVEKTL